MNWKYHNPKFEFNNSLSSSWWGHTFFAYDLIINIKPKRVVELGTHYGVSFFSMCQAVKDISLDTEICAVDTWEGDPHAKVGYDDKGAVFDIFEKEIEANYKNLNIKIHRKFFDEAAKEFEDGSIDILHIDGFHTYDAVKHDFDTWLPKVKRDGIILFHDIHERKDDFGVYKLWEEIKREYSTIEFYHWHGLGVIFLDEKIKNHFIEKEDEFKGFYNNISERFFIDKQHIEYKNKIKNLENRFNNQINEIREEINKKNWELRAIKSSKIWKFRDLLLPFKKIISGKNKESGYGDINKYIKENNIEFIDFGASKGGSIEFAKKHFCKKSGKGVGIDIDQKKIDEMKEKGYSAFYGDVTELQLSQKVRFMIMSHFLEHIDGFENNKRCIKTAAKNSTDFFYIQQPYFDADGYLFMKGLKFFWSHWVGHRNHMGMLELYKILQEILERKEIIRYAIYVYNKIESSADDKIQSISASVDQHNYDKKVHPRKDSEIRFDEGTEVFQEVRVLATIKPNVNFEEIEKSFPWTKKVYDSAKNAK